MSLGMLLVVSTLLATASTSSCEDLVSKLPAYTCLGSEPFYVNSGTEFFKINGNAGTQMLVVKDNDPSSHKDHEAHKSLLKVGGVLTYDLSFEDQDINKICDVVEDCVDTVNLESTLLTNKDFFADETVLVNFFIKLLKAVGDIHDQGLVVSNLTMDSVFISKTGEPRIQNLSQSVQKDSKDTVSVSLSEYTSPELYNDSQHSTPHTFTGWEDYYAVGVMFFYAAYHKFPYELTQVTSFEDFGKITIKYGNTFSYAAEQLMQALIVKYAGEQTVEELKKFASNLDVKKWDNDGELGGDYQIRDIRNFVQHFDTIDQRYMNIISANSCVVAIGGYGSGDLTRRFVDGEIETEPQFKEYFEFIKRNKISDNGLDSRPNNVSVLLNFCTLLLTLLVFL